MFLQHSADDAKNERLQALPISHQVVPICPSPRSAQRKHAHVAKCRREAHITKPDIDGPCGKLRVEIAQHLAGKGPDQRLKLVHDFADFVVAVCFGEADEVWAWLLSADGIGLLLMAVGRGDPL